MNQLTVTLPITPTAVHRFAMGAQAEGVCLEAYLARVAERGFGVPLAQLVGEVFSDAEDCGRAHGQRRNAA